MRVLTAQQMRDADRRACARVGDAELMRAAGESIAQIAVRYATRPKAVAFAGGGNNGGDAFAALAAMPPAFERIVYAQDSANASDGRRAAEERARSCGVVTRGLPRTIDEARDALHDCGIAFDGLLGIGARLPAPQAYKPAIDALNGARCPVLAIDVPTGLDATSGAAVEPVVRATATVTLGAPKLGLLLTPGRSYAGEMWLAAIGMGDDVASQASTFQTLTAAEFLDLLPGRAANSDKRKAGAPLILAGSEQFPGAAVLCALGAARAGAGYVTLATPAAAAAAIRAHLIEQVVITIDDRAEPNDVVEMLLDTAKRCSSLAVGPGLRLDDRTGAIVRDLVRRCDLPIVADASALFHFAKHLPEVRDARLVVTPHESEFARLSGKGTVREDQRVERVREFVDRTGILTLLKGEATLVYDGNVMHVNTTGTSALATAGTGDVLTGIIATLLAQGLSPADAARAGAYWHGLAGKRAADVRRVGVIARDIPDALAAALPSRGAPADPVRLV